MPVRLANYRCELLSLNCETDDLLWRPRKGAAKSELLFLCVRLVIDWELSRKYPTSYRMTTGISLSTPATLSWIRDHVSIAVMLTCLAYLDAMVTCVAW